MSVDLHIHSNISDGGFSPAEIVRRAAAAGLTAISLTDHDSVGGIEPAVTEGKRLGVRVVPGLEVSTSRAGKPIHLLLYGFQPRDQRLTSLLDERRELRKERLHSMIEKLGDAGITVSLDDPNLLGREALGRASLAGAMVAKGVVSNVQEAFDRYLSRGKPAYVPLEGLNPESVINLAHELGAVCSLAHPGVSVSDEDILYLHNRGLDALEVVHTRHDPEQIRHYRSLASRIGLVPTGGSDCHGPGSSEGILLGTASLPEADFHVFLEAARRRRESVE